MQDENTTQALSHDNLAENKEDRSFENLVYWQVRSCCFLGSQDRQNAGKVFVMDKDGMRREIVRLDWGDAFKNGVNILVALVSAKMAKEHQGSLAPVKTIDEAYKTFAETLVHLAQNTNVLGYRYRAEYVKYDKAKYGTNPKE
jgi:hypothetical protein